MDEFTETIGPGVKILASL